MIILRHKLTNQTFVLFLTFFSLTLSAQEKPPRPLTIFVNPAQGLNFGAFVQGNSGGSVIIYPNGSRSVTGTVIQANLGFSFSPAIFEIDAEPGTLVTISNGPDVNLTGSNGGSMVLHVGAASINSPFIISSTPPSRTLLTIGGTLTVGNPIANPPGLYNGTFSVTFIQQ